MFCGGCPLQKGQWGYLKDKAQEDTATGWLPGISEEA